MSITHLTAKAVAIPLKRKTWMSTRALTERQFLLVWLSDDDGVTGMGYSYAGTVGGQLLADTVRDVLSAVVLGSDADDIPGLWRRMYQESILIGRRGAVLRAMSAVDIALWDLRARALRRVAGAAARWLDRAAAARLCVGRVLPLRRRRRPTDAVGAEIAAARELGFTDHKIKVGGLTVAEDAERVAAAVDAIGGRGRLALGRQQRLPHGRRGTTCGPGV